MKVTIDNRALAIYRAWVAKGRPFIHNRDGELVVVRAPKKRRRAR